MELLSDCDRPRSAPVAIAGAVAVSLFGISYLTGMLTVSDPAPTVAGEHASPSAPAKLVPEAAPGNADPADQENADPAGQENADPADREAADAGATGARTPEPGRRGAKPADPVSLAQPVTGPGRPPLPMGSGPHGTRRTTGAGYAALTFDDGPDPQWTPEVLALLRKHDIKATFCVVGQLVEAYPGLVADIATGGHTLCNHSWSHDVGLGSRPRAQIRADLERTNQAIRAAAPDARISYYRQPGGAWTPAVVTVAAELGMSSLHWAVDPQDWSRPGADAVADRVSSAAGAGTIVLLHDGGGERDGTVRALRRFLPDLATQLRLAALPPGVDAPRRHGHQLPLKPGQI